MTKLSAIIIVCSIFLLFSHTAIRGEAPSLSVEYQRITSENNKNDTTSGTIYYHPDKPLLIKTSSPHLQWMRIEGKTLFLWYPEEKRAMRIVNKAPFSIPFFHNFLSVFDQRTSFNEMGFTFLKDSLTEQGYLSLWKAPKSYRKIATSAASVHNKEGQILKIEIRDKNNIPIAYTTFDNFSSVDTFTLPLHFNTVSNSLAGYFSEHLYLNKPVFGVSASAIDSLFNIPADIKIENHQF